MSWTPSSPWVRELIRRAAEIALTPQPEWRAEVDGGGVRRDRRWSTTRRQPTVVRLPQTATR
ncbi:hypothetical protein Drose_21825 [Dactylosporangium roseum]|uniref:Uncharacterized protein n=1 Tax=Dactylosporangium roseum TaxID=47989 RepID=A0ABY5YXC4_9ACTN|nr:hypothetical protein [Dactylosporangium roseum]UWZ33907.1 hypothetical protein Drose_21825 [Dactylosporangium roseum]